MRIDTGRTAFLKLAVIVAFAGTVASVSFLRSGREAIASASGPSASHTDAPGEDNCTECHISFPVNSGGGGVAIAGVPASYRPNQQIPVTVTTSQEDAVVYGFQLTAIDGRGRPAGTWTLPVQSPPQIQTIQGPVGPNLRQYVEHTHDGIIPTVFGSKSWTFTWTAPEQRVGKVGFYAAGNAANGNGNTSGDHIYTAARASLSGPAVSDFDGDLTSDVGVYRPSTGAWYSYNISTGAVQSALFGLPEDRITPGDYDGDGETDYAVFRPSTGTWYLQRSSLGFFGIHFGSPGDVPVQGDYDGDGKTDIAVYRPSTGVWYLLQSTAGFAAIPFGLNGDKPVQGDYDADGKADIAVFRPSSGIWYMNLSTTGFSALQFGLSDDKPVQADYDGDGKTDIAVYRPSTGTWYLLKSSEGFYGTAFGLPTDVPAAADYDGDGEADLTVFRPSTGAWYITQSANNSFQVVEFGINGDVPIAAGYIPQ